MKRLILDEKTWRCGGDAKNPKNRRGAASTATNLLNPQGRMCCLGIFSLQLNKSLKKKDILELSEPGKINCKIEGLNEQYHDWYSNSNLSRKAMSINDNTDTTVEEKVKLLKTLFLENGFKIVFKRRK